MAAYKYSTIIMNKSIKGLKLLKMRKKSHFFKKTLFKNRNPWYTQNEKGVFLMRNVIDISNYIIKYCMEKDYKITNLRLQKILYYVQGYFFKAYDQPAFLEEIVAWPYGPVVPEAYYNFCSFCRDDLCLYENIEYDFSSISKEEKKYINTIVDICSNISVTELVNKTHSEEPWKTTRERARIDFEKIAGFFQFNDPLGIGV